MGTLVKNQDAVTSYVKKNMTQNCPGPPLNWWTHATTYVGPQTLLKTLLVVSMFWLSRLPSGSSLFFIRCIYSFVSSVSPQRKNKPIISNKYLNLWRDEPDNASIVGQDMSSLTGTFISMDRFSDTWHSRLFPHYRDITFIAHRHKTLETVRLMLREVWNSG